MSKSFNESTIQRVAEEKIQQAMANGEFENLPGMGKPFEFDELNYDPNWWIRRKLEREQLERLSNGKIALQNLALTQGSSRS